MRSLSLLPERREKVLVLAIRCCKATLYPRYRSEKYECTLQVGGLISTNGLNYPESYIGLHRTELTQPQTRMPNVQQEDLIVPKTAGRRDDVDEIRSASLKGAQVGIFFEWWVSPILLLKRVARFARQRELFIYLSLSTLSFSARPCRSTYARTNLARCRHCVALRSGLRYSSWQICRYLADAVPDFAKFYHHLLQSAIAGSYPLYSPTPQTSA